MKLKTEVFIKDAMIGVGVATSAILVIYVIVSAIAYLLGVTG